MRSFFSAALVVLSTLFINTQAQAQTTSQAQAPTSSESGNLSGGLFTKFNQIQAPLANPNAGPVLDLQGIIARGKLVVGMVNIDNPPFYMEVDGKFIGLDVEMMESFGRLLGVRVEFNREAKSFNQVVDMVAAGQIDIGASKLSRSFSRGMIVAFSRPYLKVRHGLLLNRVEFAKMAKGRPSVQVIKSFNKRLAVIQGSSFVDFAKTNFPEAELVQFETWAEVLDEVRAGRSVAAYRDELEIKKVVREDPSTALNLRTVVLKDTTDSIALAVNHKNNQLLAQLNLFLETSASLYTPDDLLNKYEKYLFFKK